MTRVLAALLCMVFLAADASASGGTEALLAEQALCKVVGCQKGTLLNHSDWIPAGNSGSDWLALAFALNGVPERYDTYLADLERYVTQRYEKDGCLDTVRATEYHRIALTVLALGGDPTAFGTDRDGNSIDLIADGTWRFASGVDKQGLNGVIWALIALDSNAYSAPQGSETSAGALLTTLLDSQNEDGGFELLPGASDVDITAMALTAMAPHRARCEKEIDAALTFLMGRMDENAQYMSFHEANAESAAQVVIALCSLGIDPQTDTRFQRNGLTLLDSLASFRLEDGTYRHTMETDRDVMATEQVLLALAACDRLRSGGKRIYDFTDYTPAFRESGAGNSVLVIAVGAAALLCVAAIAMVIVRKKRGKQHASLDK